MVFEKALLSSRISEFLKLFFFVCFVVICVLRSVSLLPFQEAQSSFRVGCLSVPQWPRDNSVQHQ